eukprot:g9600.t1
MQTKRSSNQRTDAVSSNHTRSLRSSLKTKAKLIDFMTRKSGLLQECEMQDLVHIWANVAYLRLEERAEIGSGLSRLAHLLQDRFGEMSVSELNKILFFAKTLGFKQDAFVLPAAQCLVKQLETNPDQLNGPMIAVSLKSVAISEVFQSVPSCVQLLCAAIPFKIHEFQCRDVTDACWALETMNFDDRHALMELCGEALFRKQQFTVEQISIILRALTHLKIQHQVIDALADTLTAQSLITALPSNISWLLLTLAKQPTLNRPALSLLLREVLRRQGSKKDQWLSSQEARAVGATEHSPDAQGNPKDDGDSDLRERTEENKNRLNPEPERFSRRHYEPNFNSHRLRRLLDNHSEAKGTDGPNSDMRESGSDTHKTGSDTPKTGSEGAMQEQTEKGTFTDGRWSRYVWTRARAETIARIVNACKLLQPASPIGEVEVKHVVWGLVGDIKRAAEQNEFENFELTTVMLSLSALPPPPDKERLVASLCHSTQHVLHRFSPEEVALALMALTKMKCSDFKTLHALTVRLEQGLAASQRSVTELSDAAKYNLLLALHQNRALGVRQAWASDLIMYFLSLPTKERHASISSRLLSILVRMEYKGPTRREANQSTDLEGKRDPQLELSNLPKDKAMMKAMRQERAAKPTLRKGARQKRREQSGASDYKSDEDSGDLLDDFDRVRQLIEELCVQVAGKRRGLYGPNLDALVSAMHFYEVDNPLLNNLLMDIADNTPGSLWGEGLVKTLAIMEVRTTLGKQFRPRILAKLRYSAQKITPFLTSKQMLAIAGSLQHFGLDFSSFADDMSRELDRRLGKPVRSDAGKDNDTDRSDAAPSGLRLPAEDKNRLPRTGLQQLQLLAQASSPQRRAAATETEASAHHSKWMGVAAAGRAEVEKESLACIQAVLESLHALRERGPGRPREQRVREPRTQRMEQKKREEVVTEAT